VACGRTRSSRPTSTKRPEKDELPAVWRRGWRRQGAGGRGPALGAGAEPAFVLAGGHGVGVGRRVLGKPEDAADARRMLELLSRARSQGVYAALRSSPRTAGPDGDFPETRVQFKRLEAREIEAFVASEEWRDAAGGLQGPPARRGLRDGAVGSFTGVVGLPLYETLALLRGLAGGGERGRQAWLDVIPGERGAW
jgi:septum formation protein